MVVGILLLSLGGVLVVAEINTLTFYLLAVALACFAAGAVSVAGAGLPVTLGVLGGVSLLGLPLAHWLRARLRNPEADRISADDVGRTVTVDRVDGGALQVSYRGSVWQARLAGTAAGDPPRAGERLRIARREGNVLIVERDG